MTVVASKYAPQPNQLYETPAWATEGFLYHFGHLLSRSYVWEPSAGNHKMADVLRPHSRELVTSDIETYTREHDFHFDFLKDEAEAPLPYEADWIITNPPYGAGNRLAVRYVELALKRASNVAMLLTAKFDFGKTRTHLFRDNPRFRAKINLMDRLSFFDDKTGTEDHAWYVWTGPCRYSVFPELLYYEKQVDK